MDFIRARRNLERIITAQRINRLKRKREDMPTWLGVKRPYVRTLRQFPHTVEKREVEIQCGLDEDGGFQDVYVGDTSTRRSNYCIPSTQEQRRNPETVALPYNRVLSTSKNIQTNEEEIDYEIVFGDYIIISDSQSDM